MLVTTTFTIDSKISHATPSFTAKV